MQKTALPQEYLRPNKKFPTVWCPGCGIGLVMASIIRAVDSLELDRNDVALVSGIGCSSRMPVYVDFCTIHTTHGRALAFATGLKLAKPRMKVIVVMGDGDALAIGGNHFIHTARRNMNITAIVINNMIYGMTGGQYSPATPTGGVATTAVYGNIDQPFDISALAQVAGASFVARSTVAHILEVQKHIAHAIEHPGFSVVEVMSNCHTYYGKMNRISTPAQFHKWFKEETAASTLPPEKREGKITRGVFVDRVLPGYLESYTKMMERARKEKI